MTDEDAFEDLDPEDVKMSDVNPVTGAWHDPHHPLHEEDLSEMERMRLGDIWRQEGRKFDSLSDEKLAQRVAEARAQAEKFTDELLLIGEHVVRILEHSGD